MAGIDDVRAERLKKLELLTKQGMHPYEAYTSHDGDAILNFLQGFDEQVVQGKPATIAGRVMSIREHGGSVFFDLYDGTASIQGYLKRDHDAALFDLFREAVDRGDFIEITGTPFLTKRGEKSVLTAAWRMLTKSLMPMPQEWFGLKDDDERYRHRYINLLLEDEVRDVFIKKALFWLTMRNFLHERGFLEVETPTLELTTGGAEARPFQTHHNDFDLEVYLRISVGELWQKRLMAAGFPRTFEIGRVFRNEGTSPEHLQEFTNMEFYAAYMNFEDGKALIRDLYIKIAKEVFGTTKFERKGHTFDLADEWKDIDYVSTVRDITGVDVLSAVEAELSQKLSELGVEHVGANRERLTDSLWKYCRRTITGPVFLVNHPKLVAPLSKERPEDPRLTYTTQVIIAGTELGRAHAELNDPMEQRIRFEAQQKLLQGGDAEAMMPDWDFVEMLEYGMPPTFGFGVGERLFSTLAGVSIREAQLFPLMRPKKHEASKKSKERKIAVAVVNKKDLEPWQILNTVAHLSAELGVRGGGSLLHQDTIVTADKKSIPLNIQHAIMLKETPSTDALRKLLEAGRKDGLQVAAFTREMLETTNDTKVIEKTGEQKFSDIEFLGILVFGPASMVEKLTKDFSLYS